MYLPISVILTTFNGARYLKKQINSILTQTVLPEEVIICDDNSTDDTAFILNGYAGNGLINFHVNSKQIGVVENFKKAAKLAKQGNWIVFADQDDIWIPGKLEKLRKEMQLIDDTTKPALIYSDLTIINDNDEVIFESFWEKQKIRPEKINLSTLLYGNVVTGCTMIVNSAMVVEFLKMDSHNFLHDEWLALIAYSFGEAKFLREKLVLYRQHDNNVTFSNKNPAPGFIENIKNEINHFVGKKKFLPRQFELAKAFLLKYKNRLSNEQVCIIEDFIQEENKNYLIQRINRRKTYS
jgi:glycosyltransferase involved in cell wall biosynthesis